MATHRAGRRWADMDLTLDTVRTDVTSRLVDAANNRRSPMHTPVVATSDADLRMMVLRAFDPESWTLRLHTDARSPKAALLGDEAPVGVLFYDGEDRVQIRCRGSARLEHDTKLADNAWSTSSAFARRCYLGQPPGQTSDAPTSGLPDDIGTARPSEAVLEPARANFALLLIEIETIDWYALAHTGHRRALLTRETAHWLTP